MSSRTGYIYKITKANAENYVKNFSQFFPGVEWEISCDDMTITSSDVGKAITRLNPSETDVITLKIDRIWVLRPLLSALPKMKTVTVSDELRRKLEPQVRLALDPEKYEAENVNQSIDWNLVPEFMTILQELSDAEHGLAVCMPLPSRNMIVYASNYLLKAQGFCGGAPSTLSAISVKDGKFQSQGHWGHGAPWMVFDIDDGFVNQNNGPVAKELTDAFNAWTAHGKVGPIFA
jgi:hypothetical protein